MPTEAYQQGYSDFPKWNPPRASSSNFDIDEYEEGWNDAKEDAGK